MKRMNNWLAQIRTRSRRKHILHCTHAKIIVHVSPVAGWQQAVSWTTWPHLQFTPAMARYIFFFCHGIQRFCPQWDAVAEKVTGKWTAVKRAKLCLQDQVETIGTTSAGEIGLDQLHWTWYVAEPVQSQTELFPWLWLKKGRKVSKTWWSEWIIGWHKLEQEAGGNTSFTALMRRLLFMSHRCWVATGCLLDNLASSPIHPGKAASECRWEQWAPSRMLLGSRFFSISQLEHSPPNGHLISPSRHLIFFGSKLALHFNYGRRLCSSSPRCGSRLVNRHS